MDTGTIVVLAEGVELLGVVCKGKARVVIYRDTREGVYQWYELEFLLDSGWETILRVGDGNISDAIDLLTDARKLAADKASPSHDDHD